MNLPQWKESTGMYLFWLIFVCSYIIFVLVVGGVMLMLDWRIDLRCQDNDLAGVVEASTCMAISLMRNPLLDGVCWSCKSSLAAVSALSTGKGAPRVKVSTPVGDAIGVIWLSL